jgi:hypothetical protein
LRVLSDRAAIQVDLGQKEAAVRTLTEAIDYAKTLSEAQVSRRQVEALEKKLAEVKAR